jgi:uncharacterized protein
LTAGEGRRLEIAVPISPFVLGGDRYVVEPDLVQSRVDVSRTTGNGYALRLRFDASLAGPCMRCLEPAVPRFEVDALEVSQPGQGEELESPYVDNETLDVGAWARDALALSLPEKLLCRADCAGLCPVCGADPRWSKLSELRFD